ncbi:MAG: hypothetical protein ACH346_01455 [Chthoniobacterales bacterium]
MVSASPQWQHWIFIAAATWLLFETWRGWRLGLIRGVLRVMTLLAAWLAASAAAAAVSGALAVFFRTPPSIFPTIAATIVGLGVYFFSAFIAGLLFKKTTDHHGLLRWILGLGGAICGLLFGLFFLWGGISLIRSLGVLGEMRLLEEKQKGLPPGSDQLACNLVRLSKSLELGSTGRFLMQVDPLSTTFYDNARKFMVVVSDRDALMRFVTAPATQKLLQNPRFMMVLRDPQIQAALASRDILPLFKNKNIQAAFHDPEVIEQLKAFDLTSALNYALQKPAP